MAIALLCDDFSKSSLEICTHCLVFLSSAFTISAVKSKEQFLIYISFTFRKPQGPISLTFPSPSAHPTDIFSIAPTPTTLITASGSSTIRIFSTVPSRDSSDGTGGQALDEGINAGSGLDPFPLVKSLERVHKIGCHHVTASQDGKRLVSVGFGGEVKIWDCESGDGVNWLEREGAKFGGGGGELISLVV